MVAGLLFIGLIGDMTNEYGKKRRVSPEREMDVLLAGGVGQVQLALASGQGP